MPIHHNIGASLPSSASAFMAKLQKITDDVKKLVKVSAHLSKTGSIPTSFTAADLLHALGMVGMVYRSPVSMHYLLYVSLNTILLSWLP